MLNEDFIGKTQGPDGSLISGRASRIGAKIVAHGQGSYYEQSSRGNIFSMIIPAWTSTIAAGNIVGAAASASTQFALWNPVGSGVNLSLLKFQVWAISGTAPVPPLSHSISITAPSIATTVIQPITCNNSGLNISGLSAPCKAGGLASAAGAALTGSTALRYLRAADLGIGAGATVPANLFQRNMTEYIDGDIVIAPGTCWVPTWMAAGTAFLGGYSITWEEVPV